MEGYCVFILLCFVMPAVCFRFTGYPDKPLVVYYKNRTNVELRWEWELQTSVLTILKIKRYRSDNLATETHIAYYPSRNPVDTTKYSLTVVNKAKGYVSFIIKDVLNQGNNEGGTRVDVMEDGAAYVYKILVDTQPEGKEYIDTVQLKMLKIPVITKYPSNQTVSGGGTITFECVADGKPKPTVKWEKIWSSQSFSDGPKLTITNFDASKIGVYRCTAKSVGIAQNASAIAFVQFPTCGSGCSKEELGIEFPDLVYNHEYGNQSSTKYKELKNGIEIDCLTAYALKGKPIHKCELLRYREGREGSIVAVVELGWPTHVVDPKQPLLQAINDSNFAGYRVKPEFVSPTSFATPIPPTTSSHKDIDECASNPCQNGGACTDLVNGFTCRCAPGWEGQNCNQNINECASNPCKNGGNCTDLVNGYTCKCAPGWEGQNCTKNINECASNPCKNGGTCTDVVNGFTCSCAPGWEGQDCNNNINECASNPCKNRGNCTDLVNGFTCSCAPGCAKSLINVSITFAAALVLHNLL